MFKVYLCKNKQQQFVYIYQHKYKPMSYCFKGELRIYGSYWVAVSKKSPQMAWRWQTPDPSRTGSLFIAGPNMCGSLRARK